VFIFQLFSFNPNQPKQQTVQASAIHEIASNFRRKPEAELILLGKGMDRMIIKAGTMEIQRGGQAPAFFPDQSALRNLKEGEMLIKEGMQVEIGGSQRTLSVIAKMDGQKTRLILLDTTGALAADSDVRINERYFERHFDATFDNFSVEQVFSRGGSMPVNDSVKHLVTFNIIAPNFSLSINLEVSEGMSVNDVLALLDSAIFKESHGRKRLVSLFGFPENDVGFGWQFYINDSLPFIVKDSKVLFLAGDQIYINSNATFSLRYENIMNDLRGSAGFSYASEHSASLPWSIGGAHRGEASETLIMMPTSAFFGIDGTSPLHVPKGGKGEPQKEAIQKSASGLPADRKFFFPQAILSTVRLEVASIAAARMMDIRKQQSQPLLPSSACFQNAQSGVRMDFIAGAAPSDASVFQPFSNSAEASLDLKANPPGEDQPRAEDDGAPGGQKQPKNDSVSPRGREESGPDDEECPRKKNSKKKGKTENNRAKFSPIPLPTVKNLQAVIFDLDGIAVDSERAHLETFNSVLAHFGVKIDGQRWRQQYTGVGSFAIMRDVFARHGIKEDVREWVARRADVYQKYVARHGLPEMTGFKKVKRQLEAAGVKTIIASGGHRLHIAESLRAISLPMMRYVGLEDVKNQKPAPDLFLLAASCAKAKPSQCIVFEDSLAGIKAAQAAGMPCIALATTLPKEKLAGKASLVVKGYNSPQLRIVINRLIRNKITAKRGAKPGETGAAGKAPGPKKNSKTASPKKVSRLSSRKPSSKRSSRSRRSGAKARARRTAIRKRRARLTASLLPKKSARGRRRPPSSRSCRRA
jgi:beta-phosphoglucomutase-like phosphatase (HAD superfamily)